MNGTNVGAILAAIVGGVAGAALWAVVSLITGYEVGYVAWAIGGLVGIAAIKFGGRGAQMGVIAAVIALAAIFCGKVISTHFVVEKELEGYKANYTNELYEEIKKDAADFAKLPADVSDKDLKTFMFEHKYTEAPSAEEITDENIKIFKTYDVPQLKLFAKNPPPFSEWRETSHRDLKDGFYQDFSLVSAVTENLNLFDIIFAFLGISTAYGLINRVGSRRKTPEPA